MVFVGREIEADDPEAWKKLLCIGDTDLDVIKNGLAVVASLRRRHRWRLLVQTVKGL